jgi:Ca2+-binding RTX toxin-like protein
MALLDGEDGQDALQGGGGRDVMSGGEGADIFIFGDDDRQDLVLDFQNGTDRIDLSAVEGVSGFGDLSLSKVGSASLVEGVILLDDVPRVSAIDGGDFIFA